MKYKLIVAFAVIVGIVVAALVGASLDSRTTATCAAINNGRNVGRTRVSIEKKILDIIETPVNRDKVEKLRKQLIPLPNVNC